MSKNKISFLGPYGSTFSHIAYEMLSEKFNTPCVTPENYIPAKNNNDVATTIASFEGYGALAITTREATKVTESVEGLLRLFEKYRDSKQCPIDIKGGASMGVRFCLMVRKDIPHEKITRIIAHKKALEACAQNIEKLNVQKVAVDSNGEAARMVAQDDAYKTAAAIAPCSASEMYGLRILSDDFSDAPATTTFYIFAPKGERAQISSEVNRAIAMFELPNKPGALAKILQAFAEASINLMQIHSVQRAGTSSGECDLLVEVAVPKDKMSTFHEMKDILNKNLPSSKSLCLGPYPLLDIQQD